MATEAQLKANTKYRERHGLLRFELLIPRPLLERLEHHAKAQGRSRSRIVLQLLSTALDTHEAELARANEDLPLARATENPPTGELVRIVRAMRARGEPWLGVAGGLALQRILDPEGRAWTADTLRDYCLHHGIE